MTRTAPVVTFLLTDERLRRLLSERLIDLGWKIVTATSAEEAVRRAMSTPPRLIVGDELLLPPEVVEQFRSLPTMRTVRTAILASLLPVALRDAYIKAGADAIVLLGTMSLSELERLLISTSSV